MLDDPPKPKGREKRGRPPRITREQIIHAAGELGLENLTLSAVASTLGVTVQALYHYVTDRDQLAEMVAEEIVADYPLPPDSTADWIEWADTFAHSQLRMFKATPGLAQLAMQRTLPAALGRLEQSVRLARRSGFDETTSWWATRAVQEFVFSWVSRYEIRANLARRTGESYQDSLVRMLDSPAGERAPNLKATIGQSADPEPEDERFDYTLRALLSGLSLLRRAD